MNVLKNLPLKIKILLIVILPLGAYLYVSGSNLLIGYRQLNSYDSIHELSLLSNKISQLVHDLQKERGTSAGFFGSKGEKLGSMLTSQRRDTDIKRNTLTEFIADFNLKNFDSELDYKMNKALSHLTNIDRERQGIFKQ